MTLEELIIAIVRLVGALAVLRWTLAGAIVAILVDFSDLFLKNLFDLGGVRDYQDLDKWLDQAYQLTFLAVALRWTGPARTVALFLFSYRLVGFALFEIFGQRELLVAFPNVFEFWFLLVAVCARWSGLRSLVFAHPATALTLLTIAKMAQEYVLHGGKWLDDFTAVEAVGWIWDALTGWT